MSTLDEIEDDGFDWIVEPDEIEDPDYEWFEAICEIDLDHLFDLENGR